MWDYLVWRPTFLSLCVLQRQQDANKPGDFQFTLFSNHSQKEHLVQVLCNCNCWLSIKGHFVSAASNINCSRNRDECTKHLLDIILNGTIYQQPICIGRASALAQATVDPTFFHFYCLLCHVNRLKVYSTVAVHWYRNCQILSERSQTIIELLLPACPRCSGPTWLCPMAQTDSHLYESLSSLGTDLNNLKPFVPISATSFHSLLIWIFFF